MTGYTPTTEEVREAISEWAWARRMFRPELGQSDGLEADRWLAAHDAEVRAEAESDPAKDERLVRYIAMATPIGYQSALTVVQQMTLMIQAETEARRAGVVVEEPEWEYGAQHSQGTNPHPSRKQAEEMVAWHAAGDKRKQLHARGKTALVRRRKAGPWVPVKQEGGA